jgi:ATP synthase protein I
VSEDEQRDKLSVVRAFGVLKIGFVAIASILLGCAIGYLIDTMLGLERHIFMIVFMILGIAGGYYAAYREIMKVMK